MNLPSFERTLEDQSPDDYFFLIGNETLYFFCVYTEPKVEELNIYSLHDGECFDKYILTAREAQIAWALLKYKGCEEISAKQMDIELDLARERNSDTSHEFDDDLNKYNSKEDYDRSLDLEDYVYRDNL